MSLEMLLKLFLVSNSKLKLTFYDTKRIRKCKSFMFKWTDIIGLHSNSSTNSDCPLFAFLLSDSWCLSLFEDGANVGPYVTH